MMTFHVETFMGNAPFMAEHMFPDHWEELALDKDKTPLKPRYDQYARREEHGEIIYMALRVGGILRGYYVGFIAPGLHYADCLTCTTDIYWVHPDVRGKDLPGLKLFRAVEKELIRRGVDRWFAGTKLHKETTVLFKRMGFIPADLYLSKWIGK